LPVGVDSWGVETSYNFDEVIPNVDVVMMLRVQSERMLDAFFPSEREYSRSFGLDIRRLNALRPRSIVMHPGPMNRGLEISAESADSHHSVVLAQVSNGVLIRMAVLYQLLGGQTLTDTNSPVASEKVVAK